jgi:cytochrome c oxidase cbb3-type subunit 4
VIDEGIVRGIGTVFLLLSFVALCVWAWSPGQRRRFDEASMLPFDDSDGGRGAGEEPSVHGTVR